ncbi:acetylcholinesterase-like [Oppia nitens]|uniref:acetylcholinesterase-like n=1 Tax=Oppia nitens TaxID=1686743 RepID=UPI0023DC475D|nr:acetylcholinesterase-like [Oppia nitens]
MKSVPKTTNNNNNNNNWPSVKTPVGKIVGTSVQRLGRRVNCFLGIPYAEPPVGKLRFRKPVPKNRVKVIKAIRQPNYCWQKQWDIKNHYAIKPLLKWFPDWTQTAIGVQRSEDCLYLNVYQPVLTNNNKNNLTVMVWIYGGGFLSGAISLYDGSVLASTHEVLVVTISYRVGMFGFLAAPADDDDGNSSSSSSSGSSYHGLAGNWGLHDQVLALQWIKLNIHWFGGNPDNIVLFGESAGAISVGYHMISPKSQQLFHRAIMESGDPLVPLIMASKQSHTQAVVDLIQAINCSQLSTNSTHREIIGDGIECLRHANVREMYNISEILFQKHLGVFMPIVDNDFFADHPQELVNNRSFYSAKEILIGTNAVEGAYFSSFGPMEKYWRNDTISENFTKQAIDELVNESVPAIFRSLAAQAVNFTLDGIEDQNNSSQLWNRYIQIVGDIIFVCPDQLFIDKFADSRDHHSVYYYRFNRISAYLSHHPKWVTGAVHSEEIQFVFGVPLIATDLYTREERQLSRHMMTLWTNFAKTGNPMPDNPNQWIAYTPQQQRYMIFDTNNSYLTNGFPGYKCNDYYEMAITNARHMIANKIIS